MVGKTSTSSALQDNRSTTNKWRSSRFRSLIYTYDAPACGPLVREDTPTKSREPPARAFHALLSHVPAHRSACLVTWAATARA